MMTVVTPKLVCYRAKEAIAVSGHLLYGVRGFPELLCKSVISTLPLLIGERNLRGRGTVNGGRDRFRRDGGRERAGDGRRTVRRGGRFENLGRDRCHVS